MPLRIDLVVDATSPGLTRRRSLLRRPSAQTPKDEAARKQHTLVKPSMLLSARGPWIPMEMLQRIVELYVDCIYAAMTPSTPILDVEYLQSAFRAHVGPFTLVSKDFRYLLLRRFFRTMAFSSGEDSNGLLKILAAVNSQYRSQGWTGGYSWVKSLYAPSFLIAPNVESLKLLTHLRHMIVDFSHSGLLLQRSCLGQLFGTLTSNSIVLNLTSLKLTRLPRIEVSLLTMIAKCLPGLSDIYISSAEGLDVGCCPNCYEDSLTRIVHSPVPEMYPDAITLASAFGAALSPLKSLARLFFGIYLSPSDMLDLHINHASNDTDIKPTTFEGIYNCARCAKYEKITKQRELLASLVIAQYIGSLETIGWSSCFGIHCGNYRGLNTGEDNVLLGGTRPGSDIDSFTERGSSPKNEDNKELDCRCACQANRFTTVVVRKIAGKIQVERLLGEEM